MDNQLFREKSLKHISSPEELHHYLRVTGPRLWMILTAVVALLIGFIVYASTVTMENTMPIKIAGGTAFAAGGLAFIVGLLILLAVIAMTGMGLMLFIIIL